VNDGGSERQKFVQPFPPRLEMTVQRGEKTAPRRSMIMPRCATIVQRGATIVQRVETTVPRHQAYRLLREVDRDGCLREAIARFADPIACVPEPIARSAGPIVRSSRSGRKERTSRIHALWIVRRDQTIRRVGPRIAPTERLTRPHEWAIVHDSSAIARHDDLIGRPARRIVPRGQIIRHTGRRHRSRVEVEATEWSQ
jgi:hypothetical protein